MNYLLWLDDKRLVDEEVKMPSVYDSLTRVTATNYDEFAGVILENGLPKVVSFDFDLHSRHYQIGAMNNFMSLAGYDKCDIKTGLDCVRFLIKYCLENKLKIPVCYFHSQNPAGRQAMFDLITKYKAKELQNELENSQKTKE